MRIRLELLVALCVATSWLLLGRTAGAQTDAVPVPVRVCTENREWRRLDPEAMARTVWRDNRYVDFSIGTVNERVLAYYTHHFFFFATPTLNGIGKMLDWSGLTTAPPGGCGGSHDEALIQERELAIWTVGYHVASADLAGDTLTLTVEPNVTTDQGYASVQVPRPQTDPWFVRFVMPNGREVARYRYASAASGGHSPPICCADEPAPDAAVPSELPRPAGGGAVLDGRGSLTAQVIAGQERATYARYLALVPIDTTIAQAAERYAAELQTAGFTVPETATDGEWFSFTFRAAGGSASDLSSGKVLFTRPSDPGVRGAVKVSVFLNYASDARDHASNRLPKSGGIPWEGGVASGVLGLVLLSVGLLLRRRASANACALATLVARRANGASDEARHGNHTR